MVGRLIDLFIFVVVAALIVAIVVTVLARPSYYGGMIGDGIQAIFTFFSAILTSVTG